MMFIIRGKTRAVTWVGIIVSPSIGSSGHIGGTRPGQTRKKPKDLSAREREECGRGEGGGVYVVCRR